MKNCFIFGENCFLNDVFLKNLLVGFVYVVGVLMLVLEYSIFKRGIFFLYL